MAVGMISSVLEKLSTLLGEEYKKHKNMKMEVAFLKDELGSMNAVLKNLANMEEELDPQTKEWRNQVMDMAFDIEDCIDDFRHQVGENSNFGEVGFVNRMAQYVTALRACYSFTKQMEQLKTRVKDVNERRKRYKLDECSSSSNTVDPRVAALYKEAANIVGLEGPKEEVIRLLAEEESASVQSMKVVSIVGCGGLGKTTLAKEIYRDVGGRYGCKAFVSVSLKPDLMKLLSMIISKVGMAQPAYTYEVQDLIDNLRKYLEEYKYFLVLDDIWDVSAWEILRCAFPDNDKGSKIITTTRIETVAKASCNYQSEFIYKMKPLDDHNSRKLFFSRIGNDCLQPFKEISNEILQKCGGLPLAIITISSLLASQPNRSIEQWKYVSRSLRNLRINTTLDGMRQVLKLSYNNLPHHLKACMLYIGIYPEDYEIWKPELMRLWLAEGFVSETDGRDAEEIAGSYFNELINRSMIQPTKTMYNGEVVYCKVHDMILDLIRFKSEEENFLTAIDNKQAIATAWQNKVRRLSLQSEYWTSQERVEAAEARFELSHVRTLIVLRNAYFVLPISEFKSIRVLYLDCGQDGDPTDLTQVCKLFYLRYLKIVGEAQLPEKIVALKCLEEMDLGSTNCISLPLDIIDLPRLLCLHVPPGTRLPDGIQKMKSLSTLSYFDVDLSSVDNLRGVGELPNLRSLSISFNRGDDIIRQQGIMDIFWPIIKKLINCNLKSLRTRSYVSGCLPAVGLHSLATCRSCSNLEELHATGWIFPKVPTWICQHNKLSSLALIVKTLSKEDIDLLGGLPNLAHLFLWVRRSPQETIFMRGRCAAFAALQHFELWCYAPCVSFEEGAMPNLLLLSLLIHLHAVERYGLSMLDGVEHLLSLKKFSADIYFEGGDRMDPVDAMETWWNAMEVHPAHPKIEIKRVDKESFLVTTKELFSDDDSDRDEAVEDKTE